MTEKTPTATPLKAPLRPLLVLLIAVCLPGMGQIANNQATRSAPIDSKLPGSARAKTTTKSTEINVEPSTATNSIIYQHRPA